MAVTVSNRDEWVAGNKRIVTAKLSVIANGDTWVTGLGNITSLSVTCTTDDTCSADASGGTITFYNGATLIAHVIAIGT